MKYYRLKSDKEMEKSFGSNWRKKLNVAFKLDDYLGKRLTESQNVCVSSTGQCIVNQLYKTGDVNSIPIVDEKFLIEINPLSAELEKTFIDEEKGKVTVILKNGNIGRAACSPEDTFDPYVGFAVAYARAVAGSNSKFKNLVDGKLALIAKKKAKKRSEQQ